jgi:hypothetical protein
MRIGHIAAGACGDLKPVSALGNERQRWEAFRAQTIMKIVVCQVGIVS